MRNFRGLKKSLILHILMNSHVPILGPDYPMKIG
jgi:hypothetical protein